MILKRFSTAVAFGCVTVVSLYIQNDQKQAEVSRNVAEICQKCRDVIGSNQSNFAARYTNFSSAAEAGPVKYGELLAVVRVEVGNVHLSSS